MSLRIHVRYARVTRVFTCKLTVGAIAHNFVMADKLSSEDHIDGPKDSSPEEFDNQDFLSEPTLEKKGLAVERI